MDHAQAIEKEKEFARRWMRKHGAELPSMYDGERINGDPIIYRQPPREGQLREAVSTRFDEQIAIDQRDRRTAADALINIAVSKSETTALQAWVLAFRMLGLTQEEIAKAMKMKRESVVRCERYALRNIKNTTKLSAK
ncbi:MAG: hypothetical protein ABIH23_19725 [bacterium]